MDRLYSYLDEDARTVLSRLAVYDIPVSREALGAVSGLLTSRVDHAIRSSLNQGLTYRPPAGQEVRWAVYGVLRPWLLA